MKIRADFVTNSSSSGFVAIKIKSETLDKLLKKTHLGESIFAEVEEADEGNIGVPWAIKPDVALSLCQLLLYGLPLPSSEEYGEIWDEVHEEFIESEYSSYSDISRLINEALEMVSDNELEEDEAKDQQFIGVLNLIKLICKSRKKINADATAKISSGTVRDEGRYSEISYASIDVKNGNGIYTEFINDSLDVDYDDYYYGEPQFFEEIAETHHNTKRIQIGNGNDNSSNKTVKKEKLIDNGETGKHLNNSTSCDWMKDKIFVLTGFDETTENQHAEIINRSGGTVKDSTVLKTNYLIYNPDYGRDTKKLKRAKELIEQGKDIVILSENEFLEKL